MTSFFSARNIWKWLPSTVLVVVAVTQMTLAMTAQLTPWKGGGFGMFARVDGRSERRFRFEAQDETGKTCLLVVHFADRRPPAFLTRDLGQRLRTMPDRARLQQVGELLLREEFVLDKQRQHRILRALPHREPQGKLLVEQSLSPFYRIAMERDGLRKDHVRQRFTAIRISLWRECASRRRRQLWWSQLGEPVSIGEWQ